MKLTREVISQVASRLGREPRGLEEVATVDEKGLPAVIRVASIVDGKPFPTLYWLIDPVLCYRIDGLEAGGLIAQLQCSVDESSRLQAQMREDHRLHIAQRAAFMTEQVKAEARTLGYWDVLMERGIGGLADFSRIRCLHTWYAAHLVVPNTVGGLVDAHWEKQP